MDTSCIGEQVRNRYYLLDIKTAVAFKSKAWLTKMISDATFHATFYKYPKHLQNMDPRKSLESLHMLHPNDLTRIWKELIDKYTDKLNYIASKYELDFKSDDYYGFMVLISKHGSEYEYAIEEHLMDTQFDDIDYEILDEQGFKTFVMDRISEIDQMIAIYEEENVQDEEEENNVSEEDEWKNGLISDEEEKEEDPNQWKIEAGIPLNYRTPYDIDSEDEDSELEYYSVQDENKCHIHTQNENKTTENTPRTIDNRTNIKSNDEIKHPHQSSQEITENVMEKENPTKGLTNSVQSQNIIKPNLY